MEGAKIAFRSWRTVRVSEPSRYLQRYPQLLIQHHDELGELIRQDAGKIIKAAKDDVWPSIEVVELTSVIFRGITLHSLQNFRC